MDTAASVKGFEHHIKPVDQPENVSLSIVHHFFVIYNHQEGDLTFEGSEEGWTSEIWQVHQQNGVAQLISCYIQYGGDLPANEIGDQG